MVLCIVLFFLAITPISALSTSPGTELRVAVRAVTPKVLVLGTFGSREVGHLPGEQPAPALLPVSLVQSSLT